MGTSRVITDAATGAPIYGTFYSLVDNVSSTTQYIGEALYQNAAQSSAVWRIKRITINGNITTTQYAGTGRFEHAWSDRTSLFSAVSFFNNYSVLFDGINDYVTFGNNINYDIATQFSVSLWIRPNNLSAIRTFVSKAENAGNIYGWSLRHETTGQLTLQARVPGALTSQTSTNTVTAGVWNHVVLTYSGNSNVSGFKVYVNNVSYTYPAFTLPASWLASQDFVLGARGTNTQYFSGNIDEVSVWNKQLSAAEVATLYNSGVPTNCSAVSFNANLTNYWRLGDGDSYPTIYDNAGLINGTMTNMTSAAIVGSVP